MKCRDHSVFATDTHHQGRLARWTNPTLLTAVIAGMTTTLGLGSPAQAAAPPFPYSATFEAANGYATGGSSPGVPVGSAWIKGGTPAPFLLYKHEGCNVPNDPTTPQHPDQCGSGNTQMMAGFIDPALSSASVSISTAVTGIPNDFVFITWQTAAGKPYSTPVSSLDFGQFAITVAPGKTLTAEYKWSTPAATSYVMNLYYPTYPSDLISTIPVPGNPPVPPDQDEFDIANWYEITICVDMAALDTEEFVQSFCRTCLGMGSYQDCGVLAARAFGFNGGSEGVTLSARVGGSTNGPAGTSIAIDNIEINSRHLCYADCDLDGSLTINDFICFQTSFALTDPYADCDGDTLLTINDFVCFQSAFAFGCP